MKKNTIIINVNVISFLIKIKNWKYSMLFSCNTYGTKYKEKFYYSMKRKLTW